jgi:hypothetical protein
MGFADDVITAPCPHARTTAIKAPVLALAEYTLLYLKGFTTLGAFY